MSENQTSPQHATTKEQNTGEALYLVDDTVYLHVQPTDEGWDYSLYDKATRKLIDGGVLEPADVAASPVSSLAGAVRTEIFALQGMTPAKVVYEDLAVLDALLAVDTYEIYQLKNEDATALLRFESYALLQKQGLAPNPENYVLVYSGVLSGNGSPMDYLEDLYYKFNMERPADFTGHSLSVSDIVALNRSGVISYPIPEEGFVGMTILGQEYQEKEAAGAALIEAAKMASGLEPVAIGQYRGLSLSVTLEDFGKKYILTMQGTVKHLTNLGSDPKGNLIRMENALGQISTRYNDLQGRLEEIHHQQEAARVELEKPFPFEEELREKTARLIFLDAELNLDGGTEKPEKEEPVQASRPSVLDKLKTPPIPGSPSRKQKQYEEER